jgi:signal transduction histidine kinase
MERDRIGAVSAVKPLGARVRRHLLAPFEPVRVRITLAATLAFGLAFAGASVALVHTVRHSLVAGANADSSRAMQHLAGQLEAGADPDRLDMGPSEPVYYEIYTKDGQVIAGSANARLPVLHAGRTQVTKWQGPDGTEYNISWGAVTVSSGPLTIAIATPLTDVRRSVDTLARSLWIGTPGLIVLVGLVVWVLVGRALRPVEAIRAQVDAISGSTMDRRVAVPNTEDEVARLARTMNGMLDRLERASARQRAFVSDASHELRSPVSTIRTELEVAAADADHADWAEVAQRTLGETDRLSRLVDDLLALARLDEAQGPRRRVPVDLDDLVLEEGTRTHRVPVRTVGVSAGRVEGDERQLTQVVRNLVDNAQRHAATQVALTLRREGDQLVFVVDDDGPGIPEPDRERIFDRFTRIDEGRGRAAGGAGLGLAVVRRVVEHHGGTVAAVDGGDAGGGLGGARFVVRLPALESGTGSG